MPHLIALGGGGFSMEPENPLLDNYILELTGKPSPKVCFVGTASGDSDGYTAKFYESFPPSRCAASHLSLFKREIVDLCGFVLSQDVVYVGGGNTANLLAVWRVHGLHTILREAWQQGIVLCGVSAGAICWFEAGVTDSFGPLAPLRGGLGFLPGSCCPHYDGEIERRPAFHQFVTDGLPGGLAADDGAGLHFVGTELHAVVTSRPNAKAYRIETVQNRVIETALPMTYLGETVG